MVADMEQGMRKACEEQGVEYDQFVTALSDAFDARFTNINKSTIDYFTE